MPSADLISEQQMAYAVREVALGLSMSVAPARLGPTLRMAEAATALWTRFHKFDAADPRWPDRDRFVVSADEGALLLYTLMHLTDYGSISHRDLGSLLDFDLHSVMNSELNEHWAEEGPAWAPGEGIASAVGMALAERAMAARFGRSLVDHRTWVIAWRSDMMAGLNHEAASLAGYLSLSRLTVLYDEHCGPANSGSPMTDDVAKRYASYGWATKTVDSNDPHQIAAGLSFATRSKKPTLIICRSKPVASSTSEFEQSFNREAALGSGRACSPIPSDVLKRWRAVGGRGAAGRRAWLKRLAHSSLRAEYERALAGRLPEDWHEVIANQKQAFADTKAALPTREASQRCLESIVPATPDLLGGSVDPRRSVLTSLSAQGAMSAGSYGARYINFAAREHGMAAAANGMAVHGGVLPCIETPFALSDHVTPAIRLSAMMGHRIIHVLTQGPAGFEAGYPAHDAVEQLAGLRAIPNLYVFRPADAIEAAECWDLAIRRSDGPSALILTDREGPLLRSAVVENLSSRGGYVLVEAEGPRRATLLATGPEVGAAMLARTLLANEGVAVAVVSLPCWELFAIQDDGYKLQVLGSAPRVGVEAARGFGWSQWLGTDGSFVGISGIEPNGRSGKFGAHLDVTAEAVASAVKKLLALREV